MRHVFIPQQQAGLALEQALRAPLAGDTKRRRQVLFREIVTVLRALGLIDSKAKPIGLAEGTNYLGEKGFWVVMEAQREVPEGLPSLQCVCTMPRGRHIPACPASTITGGEETHNG